MLKRNIVPINTVRNVQRPAAQCGVSQSVCPVIATNLCTVTKIWFCRAIAAIVVAKVIAR